MLFTWTSLRFASTRNILLVSFILVQWLIVSVLLHIIGRWDLHGLRKQRYEFVLWHSSLGACWCRDQHLGSAVNVSSRPKRRHIACLVHEIDRCCLELCLVSLRWSLVGTWLGPIGILRFHYVLGRHIHCLIRCSRSRATIATVALKPRRGPWLFEIRLVGWVQRRMDCCIASLLRVETHAWPLTRQDWSKTSWPRGCVPLCLKSGKTIVSFWATSWGDARVYCWMSVVW